MSNDNALALMGMSPQEVQAWAIEIIKEQPPEEMNKARFLTKKGRWQGPEGEVQDMIETPVYGLIHIWACWSEVVGQPECYFVGYEESPCQNPQHQPQKGIGVIGLWDGFPCVYVATGALMPQYFGNAVLKRLAAGHRSIRQEETIIVPTQHGEFFVPKLQKDDPDASE